MSDPDQIKADIVATRAELIETANALAAKLDAKAQAKHKLHEVHDGAPESVRKAWDWCAEISGPVRAKIAADPKRAGLIAGGASAGLLVLRRLLRSRRR